MPAQHGKLSKRQVGGYAGFGLGAVLILVALPLTVIRYGDSIPVDEQSMWQILLMVAKIAISDPGQFRVDTLKEFLEGPLPASMIGLTYALVLPALFLIFLASRNYGFCWMGRILWLLLWLTGPVCFLAVFSESYMHGGAGYWCWFWGVLTVAASHWVMVPRREDPHRMLVPGPPSP